jgi:signal transduction histidine kinase
VISGFTQLIGNRLLGELTEHQEQSLKEVRKQSEGLLGVIDRILAVTALEMGQLNVQKEEFALADMMADLKAAYAAKAEDRLVLLWNYPSDVRLLNTDKTMVKTILQNLVENGIKFTEGGGLSVSARYLAEQSKIQFEVADTGIGISEAEFPLLFQKFRQLDNSTTRRYEGMGLGLYLVKSLTSLLGGTVSVESELGKGSTFKVVLPV